MQSSSAHGEPALRIGSHRVALVVRGDIVEFATEDAFLDVRESSMFALGDAGSAPVGPRPERVRPAGKNKGWQLLTAAAMASPLERFRAARARPRGMP